MLPWPSANWLVSWREAEAAEKPPRENSTRFDDNLAVYLGGQRVSALDSSTLSGTSTPALPGMGEMNNTTFPVGTPASLIDDICAKVADLHCAPGAAYTMIVGDGFSHGSVLLTRELLNERIGDYDYERRDLEGSRHAAAGGEKSK